MAPAMAWPSGASDRGLRTVSSTDRICSGPARTPTAQSHACLPTGCGQLVSGESHLSSCAAHTPARSLRAAGPPCSRSQGREGLRGFACRRERSGQRMGAAPACAAACASARLSTKGETGANSRCCARRARPHQAGRLGGGGDGIALDQRGLPHKRLVRVHYAACAAPPDPALGVGLGLDGDRDRALPYTAGCHMHRPPAPAVPLKGSGGAMPALPVFRLSSWPGSGVLRGLGATCFEGPLAGAAGMAGPTAGGRRMVRPGGRAAAHRC